MYLSHIPGSIYKHAGHLAQRLSISSLCLSVWKVVRVKNVGVNYKHQTQVENVCQKHHLKRPISLKCLYSNSAPVWLIYSLMQLQLSWIEEVIFNRMLLSLQLWLWVSGENGTGQRKGWSKILHCMTCTLAHEHTCVYNVIGADLNTTGIHQVVFCHVQGDCNEISQICFDTALVY